MANSHKIDKKAIKAVAKRKAREERATKKIFSVYLDVQSYQRLVEMHGRETSRVINELVNSYLEAKLDK